MRVLTDVSGPSILMTSTRSRRAGATGYDGPAVRILVRPGFFRARSHPKAGCAGRRRGDDPVPAVKAAAPGIGEGGLSPNPRRQPHDALDS
jgi:hypothetical protein